MYFSGHNNPTFYFPPPLPILNFQTIFTSSFKKSYQRCSSPINMSSILINNITHLCQSCWQPRSPPPARVRRRRPRRCHQLLRCLEDQRSVSMCTSKSSTSSYKEQTVVKGRKRWSWQKNPIIPYRHKRPLPIQQPKSSLRFFLCHPTTPHTPHSSLHPSLLPHCRHTGI